MSGAFGSGVRRRALTFVFIAIPASLVGVVVPVVSSSPGLRFVTVLVLLTGLLAGAHLLARRESGDSLNLLSLSALFYLVSVVAGGIYVWFTTRLTVGPGARLLPRPDIMVAVEIYTVAWLLFAVGYLCDPFRLVRTAVRPPKGFATSASSSVLVTWLLLIGWLARLLLVIEGRYYHIHMSQTSSTGTSWYVSMGSLLPLVALALVGARVFGFAGSRPSRGAKVVFVALLATNIAWALPSGAREEVVDVLAAVVVVRYYALGRLPSLRFVVAILVGLMFVVFPLIGAYRSTDFRASPTGALLSATQQLGSGGLRATLAAGGETLGRFADVTAMARINQEGRGQLTYSTGDILTNAAEGFIPRAILPGKGDPGLFGNEFGRAYGFVSPTDFLTSVAPTQPGDLYLGGGWIALLIGMPVLGALLRMLDEYLRARRSDRGALAVYAVIAPIVVIGLESSIAVGFVGPIKAAIFLSLVVVVLGWFSPRPARRRRPVPVYAFDQ